MTKQNEAAVLAKLREKCAGRGGQAAFAKEHGFSRAYISDVMAGRREITDRVSEILGFTRTVRYEKKVEFTENEPVC